MNTADKNSLPSYVALQPHYNLIIRDKFENEYAPLITKYNLSVFTYWSLEAGFLTGKYRKEEDFEASVRGGGIKQHFNDRGKTILKALDEVSAKHSSTPAAVSLAWLMANPLVTAPIVSATSESQLNTIFSSVELQLDTEDVEKLTAAGDA